MYFQDENEAQMVFIIYFVDVCRESHWGSFDEERMRDKWRGSMRQSPDHEYVLSTCLLVFDTRGYMCPMFTYLSGADTP